MNIDILDKLELKSGGHSSFKQGACLLEAASYLAGEPWSDHPECVSPVLAAYGRRLNDRLGNEDRQKLKVFLPGMLNTAGDGLDEERGFLAADWAVRVATPRWLEAAGLKKHAKALRALPPITSWATLRAAQDAAREARDDAYTARMKSRAALRSRIEAELAKQGKPAAAAAVAVAADVAVAVAAAVAVDVAVAVAAAVDVAVAVAAAAAADVAVAAAAAADVAVAAAADVAADADAAKYSDRWWDIYRAVKAKLREVYRTGLAGSKFAEVRDLNNAEAIELLGRMINPKATA